MMLAKKPAYQINRDAQGDQAKKVGRDGGSCPSGRWRKPSGRAEFCHARPATVSGQTPAGIQTTRGINSFKMDSRQKHAGMTEGEEVDFGTLGLEPR
jgi:hypothetical protein